MKPILVDTAQRRDGSVLHVIQKAPMHSAGATAGCTSGGVVPDARR
jgi:hypothetical protein